MNYTNIYNIFIYFYKYLQIIKICYYFKMIKSNICKKVSGQNIKIGKNYSLYCKKKISEMVNKYAVKAVSYSSNIIKRKYYYKVKLNIVLSKNADYEATGKAKFPYAALNIAIINLSKILRRHYRKIKNENKGNKKIRLLKDSFLLYNLR